MLDIQSILDLSNQSWQQVYSKKIVAKSVPGNPNNYYVIPEQKLPIDFDSYILIVGASSAKAKPRWKLACYLTMELAAIGIGNCNADQKQILLGLTLVRFPVLSKTYKVKLSIPRWFQEMDLSIWKYVGLLGEQELLLNNPKIDIERIERKIDVSDITSY